MRSPTATRGRGRVRPDVRMRTIATVVSIVLLSLLLILVGASAVALTIVWPPLGVGTIAAGAGVRLLHEIRNSPS